MKLTYRNYKCVVCGNMRRAWIESICFKTKTCFICIDKTNKKEVKEDDADKFPS